MNNNSVLHNYILFATVFLVFYPLKGLLNLSYYFFQKESSTKNKEFVAAQKLAQKNKLGLWNK